MATETPQRSNSGRNIAEVVRDASREAVEIARDISREAIGAIAGSEPALLANPVATPDVSSPDFYEHVPVEAIVHELGTSSSEGLRVAVAAERLKEEGPNELEKAKRPGIIKLFIAQLMNLIIVLLIVAAFASFGVGSAPSGAAILVIVILNAGIAAFTENQAGNALEALSNMSQPEALVVRGGVEEAIPSTTIVRGDIVVLGTGDVVAADMRLLESSDLKVDEMPLTGESEDVSKHAKPKSMDTGKLTPEHMVFSGCSVTSGTARGIVVATGMRTRVGTIAGLLAGTKKVGRCGGFLPDTSAGMTPLQASLQRLGMLIGFLAIFVCIIVFVVGLLLKTENPNDQQMAGWMYMILVAITLTVAAIPEGIPLCVTISLSSGCSTMVSKNVLVRRIAAVETLGSASVICSDKTGTLTEGKMRAVKMWAAGTNYEISGTGFDPTSGSITNAENGAKATADMGVRSTLLTALLCSNAKVEKETTEEGETKWVPNGNSSEVPIVVAAGKVGIWAAELQQAYPRKLEVPFSSSRKMMLTVTGISGSSIGDGGVGVPSGTRALACIKGAPNYVLDVCKTWVTADGSIRPFTEEARGDAMRTIDNLSSQALRVLAIAVRPLPEVPFASDDEDSSADEKMGILCQDLILLGLVASIDPPRAGVRDAVQAAHDGHIHVMMITGDYLKTAAAIARDVGILEPTVGESGALDCTSLRPSGEYLKDEDIDGLTKDARVFARAKPEDKLEIVKSLQRQGLVSAMTGDGVNDAPALNAADIGVAMGIQGTEVAKGASAMILTDDNFCSIVKAVEKGRVIYAGIQKFVAFIMSVHIAEVLQIFICIVTELPVMRTPLQILYLILVTDLAPSIALGLEPGQAGIMKDRPRPKQQPILLPWMWISTVVNSAILTGIILSVYIWGLNFYVGYTNVNTISDAIEAPVIGGVDVSLGLQQAQTVAFISLVWSENIRAYTSRSFEKPVFVELCTNGYMQRAIGVAQAALYLAIFLPGLSDILGLRGVDIGYEGWLAALVGALVCLVLCELYKVLQRVPRLLLGRTRAASKAAALGGSTAEAASPGPCRRAATETAGGSNVDPMAEARRSASV